MEATVALSGTLILALAVMQSRWPTRCPTA
jgi:hypothetical protein